MKKTLSLFLLSFFLTFFIGACTHVYTRKGMYYRVSKGDTLAKISVKYKVSAQEIAEENNIENTQQLKPGRSIYIPGMTPRGLANLIEQSKRGVKPKRKTGTSPKKKPTSSSKGKISAPPSEGSPNEEGIVLERGRFSWPIQGEISSPFGMRHGRRHDGIDVRSPIGTPIAAAADGEVVFAKRMRGYGNLVLMKHEDDFFTVYAHNSINLAKLGQKVRKGQIIAKVGRTGRATGPHLHFEVRKNTKARNPLFFLPKNEHTKQLNFEETPSKEGLKPNEVVDEHADIDDPDSADMEQEKAPLSQKTQSTQAPKKIIIRTAKKKVLPKKKVLRTRPEKKVPSKKKESAHGRIKK